MGLGQNKPAGQHKGRRNELQQEYCSLMEAAACSRILPMSAPKCKGSCLKTMCWCCHRAEPSIIRPWPFMAISHLEQANKQSTCHMPLAVLMKLADSWLRCKPDWKLAQDIPAVSNFVLSCQLRSRMEATEQRLTKVLLSCEGLAGRVIRCDDFGLQISGDSRDSIAAAGAGDTASAGVSR